MNKIGIIGLGYVGLPLARLLASKYPVIGYDINKNRIDELNNGIDSTLEVSETLLKSVLNKNLVDGIGLKCSHIISDLIDCNIYIITVPTPVDENNNPDLNSLLSASKSIGPLLKREDIVIYESTVYPGATEERCVPELEKSSGLKFNKDFYVGYSPERINPGDKLHTIDKIIKVTSGSTEKAAQKINNLYDSVISAGTHLAPSIKVAEAAKVIENSQRDINIAFINELAKIFSIMDIDTNAVLDASNTKWNFLPFKPGLVGGHCIGVDPYYLANKSIELGYYPEIILAGRKVNDSMGNFIASEVIRLMINKDIEIKNSKILILGFTFKENCPDIRNSKVIDVITSLEDYDVNLTVYDPWANSEEVFSEYGQVLTEKLKNKNYDAIILAVAHDCFKNLEINSLKKQNSIVYDVKNLFSDNLKDKNL